MLACKQIHAESRQLFYAVNELLIQFEEPIYCFGYLPAVRAITHQLGSANASALVRITVDLGRLHSRDFGRDQYERRDYGRIGKAFGQLRLLLKSVPSLPLWVRAECLFGKEGCAVVEFDLRKFTVSRAAVLEKVYQLRAKSVCREEIRDLNMLVEDLLDIRAWT